MDVASILRLNIRRRGAGQVYADCPICGDRRGKMSLNPGKNVWHCHYCGEGGGMLALYARVHNVSNSIAYEEICETLQTDGFPTEYQAKAVPAATAAMPVPTEPGQSERAPDQAVHQTLTALLSLLTLKSAHREHLRTVRGLTDEQIDSFGFKSTPESCMCRRITRVLMGKGYTVAGVPGFYVNDRGQWTVKFYTRTSGIVIPLRCIDGLIHGLQIRLDHPIRDKDDPPDKSGTKYLPLSSSGKMMGTPADGSVHFVGDPCARVVYVTEGALKADICHALTGRTFAATVGANNVSQLDGLFAELRKNGTEEIIEADDMDKFRNVMVNRGAEKIHRMAVQNDLACRRLTWNPNYKGMDDWQLALRRKNEPSKEAQEVTFKERYLSDLCDFAYIGDCVELWHRLPENSVGLREYLGLTEQEYTLFTKNGDVALEQVLDCQRRRQRYRIYQLKLDGGKTVPFAFSGIGRMRKAGFEQPPASLYRLAYDGELYCPSGQGDQDILKRIFDRFSSEKPQGYAGRYVAPSDVIELYNDGQHGYFYCDSSGFAPVEFSPAPPKAAGNG